MADLLAGTIVRQLQELDDHVRLIVVHPNYVPQHMLLTRFLQDQPSVYVRFHGAELTVVDLKEQLQAAQRIQQNSVAFNDIHKLVLDECDRATPTALEALLLELVDTLNYGQVVVLSRRTLECIDHPDICRKTRFVPVAPDFLLLDYTQRDPDTSLLEVHALGAGRVLLNGKAVDNWDGVLPRALFFYLIDRGMTTRSEIFETFWPTLSIREATNVFHVTKRKISEVLGVDLTVYWSGFYHISPKINLSYDAAVFSEMIQDSAVAAPAEAIRLLESALWLYQGDFLSSTDTLWADKRRQQLIQSYGEALIALAKLMEQASRNAEALGLYLRASVTNRQREDLARSIMLLYREAGMNADAIATYERLEAELERTLGVSPARNLQELVAEIRHETEWVRS